MWVSEWLCACVRVCEFVDIEMRAKMSKKNITKIHTKARDNASECVCVCVYFDAVISMWIGLDLTICFLL